MKLVYYLLWISLFVVTLLSCSKERSLQRYFVDKQEDNNFVKFDLPASMIQQDNDFLNLEQKEVLASVRKLNIVAFPIKDGDSLKTEYTAEKEIFKSIIDQEKYQTLIKFGSPTQGATLTYVGEYDAIDELIIFASDDDKGFVIFRLTGDKMDPEKMINVMKSVERGDLDLAEFNGFGQIFSNESEFDDDDEIEDIWDGDEDLSEEQKKDVETKIDSILREIED